MYKKILVPVDGSEFSRAALKHGAELARITGAHLTAVHVLDLPPQMKSLKSYPLLKDKLAEEGEKILGEAREISAPYNISFSERMCLGAPADEILHEARQGRYDLIVIGSRGMGEVKSWLLGSVSRRVVKHAKCPVLVVK
ncbi:MAG: universal stress protein [Peptococcaceae bacterium]|nr:universal stress protein [Peptococcaceae bacterium]